LRVRNSSACLIPASTGDYVSDTRTLTFIAGETLLRIPVMTLEDRISEVTEMFEAELSNPSAGAVLEGQTKATVHILDTNGTYDSQFDCW